MTDDVASVGSRAEKFGMVILMSVVTRASDSMSMFVLELVDRATVVTRASCGAIC